MESFIGRALLVAPLFLLGFRADLIGGAAPVLALYGLLLHANVDWSFGPLRYVFVSPAFHRWHHASDVERIDKNFAGIFPIWDLLFGTFHFPVGLKPRAFGVGAPVPAGLWRQLAWPFRRG